MSYEIEDAIIEKLNFAINEANQEENFEKFKRHTIAVYNALVSHKEQLSNGRIRNKDYYNLISVMIQKYVIPIIIVSPQNNRYSINNGTGFFLELDQKLLITNEHVLTACQSASKGARILIGKYDMSVKDFIQATSKSNINANLDLAVIKIPESLINPWVIFQNKLFYKPDCWPLQLPESKNMVILAGYPGVLREDRDNEIETFYVSIQDEIMDTSVTYSVMNFNKLEWVKQLGVRNIEELTRLGGFSGGPMFLFLDGKLILLGVVRQGGNNFFDMQFVHAKFIRKNGELCDI